MLKVDNSGVDLYILNSEIENFHDKFKIGNTDDCWEWEASLFGTGYPQFRFNETMGRGHRFAYMISKGDIPEGLVVMHSCDNRKCVNPHHLSLGTQSQNLRDCMSRGRGNKCHGERHSDAKLTEEKVIEIRRLKAEGKMSYSEIGKMFGVTKDTARKAAVRMTWKHVT